MGKFTQPVAASRPFEQHVIRRTLHRAQEVIQGLYAGNSELRRENQALYVKISALEAKVKTGSCWDELGAMRRIKELEKSLVETKWYRDIVVRSFEEASRERDTLRQERDDLLRVVQLRRGFSKQYLACVALEKELERAEFLYAGSQGAKSWTRTPGVRVTDRGWEMLP